MRYTYLENVALADVAFLATGKTLEDVFTVAADATINTMVDDLSTIQEKEKVDVDLQNETLDLLLFSFLNELVFYKDAKRLLLRVQTIRIDRKGPSFTLKAEMYGEEINRKRHHLRVDVKAVTLHLLNLRKTRNGWEATVVLDV